MVQLDQSTWNTFVNVTTPYPGSTVTFFDLTFPSDRLLVTVDSTSASGDWVRAGWSQQIWLRNDEPFLIAKTLVYLQTSELFVIEPLASCVISFEPVSWLRDWTIKIEARILE